MIVDIFQVNKKIPSTLTELYQLFIVMILQRQIKKNTGKSALSLPVTISAANEILHRTMKGIPNDTVNAVFALSLLACCGCFDWCSNRKEKKDGLSKMWKDPKLTLTTEDLIQCGIEVTVDWDGYDLLKATPTHDIPVDTITYNFAHLTIQEFLCAVLPVNIVRPRTATCTE